MVEFQEGDQVRIDIPDETDTDHNHHAEYGEITQIISKHAGKRQEISATLRYTA